MTLRGPESWDISGTDERLSASKQGPCSLELVRLKIWLILTMVAVANDVICHQITQSLWRRIILDVCVAVTGNRSSSVDTVTRLQDGRRVIAREVFIFLYPVALVPSSLCLVCTGSRIPG